MTSPPLLIFLLRLVPMLPGAIRAGLIDRDIHDVALRVIAAHRSEDQREWSDLEQIIRQDQALARATT